MTFTKYHAASKLSVVGRIEQYSGPSQIIVVAGLPESFQTTVVSLGIDVKHRARVLRPSDLRAFHSKNSVLAGLLAQARGSELSGAIPARTVLFGGIILATALIVGALRFYAALALSLIVEQVTMRAP